MAINIEKMQELFSDEELAKEILNIEKLIIKQIIYLMKIKSKKMREH